MGPLDRRMMLLAAATAGLLSPAAASAASRPQRPLQYDITPDPFADQIVLGDPAASVTVYGYISPACPQCARWYLEVFPSVEAELISTGHIRWAVREFATAMLETCYRTFVLARHVAPEAYFPLILAVLADEEAMYRSGQVQPALRRIVARFGINAAGYDACMNDWTSIANVIRRSDAAVHMAGIEATPTFVIGDVTLLGGSSTTFEMISEAIAKARGG